MMKKLEDLSRSNPFKVPENYFREVNEKIISGTLNSRPETRKVNLYSRLRPYLAVAASLALFLIIGYAALKIIRDNNDRIRIPEISMQEYSETLLNDVDIATLEEQAAPVVFSDDQPDISKNEIIDYLILENIDINEIYEFL